MTSATLHPDVDRYIAAIGMAGLPPLSEMAPAEARARLEALRRAGAPPEPCGEVETITIAGPCGTLALRVYQPEAMKEGTIVYFHGGGWVVGSIDTSDALARALANATRRRLVSLDYRLAPETQFPGALDDALAAIRYAAERWGGPLILCGDSAGGNLAAVSARRLRDLGEIVIAAQILFYPVTDCDVSRPSYLANPATVPLSSRDMQWAWGHYLADATLRENPDASPLRASSLENLPPAFIGLAEHDPLLDEGEAYAARLAAAGVAVERRLYRGTVHGFASAPALIAPARDMFADCAAFLEARL